eukprot:6201647-Pleurochrysis_carterae.AAC.6
MQKLGARTAQQEKPAFLALLPVSSCFMFQENNRARAGPFQNHCNNVPGKADPKQVQAQQQSTDDGNAD